MNIYPRRPYAPNKTTYYQSILVFEFMMLVYGGAKVFIFMICLEQRHTFCSTEGCLSFTHSSIIVSLPSPAGKPSLLLLLSVVALYFKLLCFGGNIREMWAWQSGS